jgi:uncharacterized protein YggL (DUF469 family)
VPHLGSASTEKIDSACLAVKLPVYTLPATRHKGNSLSKLAVLLKLESVASILERESQDTIRYWLSLVEQEEELTCISLSPLERTGHLPKLINDIIGRLRNEGPCAEVSMAACEHGDLRRKQGYSAPMLVDEFRILEISLFSTLQRNVQRLDFDKVMGNVVTIVDEVDSQLKQAILFNASLGKPRIPIDWIRH